MSAAAAAAIGAFTAEALRRKAEREAEPRRRKGEGSKAYRQIGKAYQASLNEFKAGLMKQGLSEEQAGALRRQAVRNGSISSVQNAAQAEAAVAKPVNPSDRPAVERPPIGGVIVAGILLALATVVLEIPLILGEAILAGPAFAGNPLAVGGELFLMSASAFLLNFEVAYWAYAYRIVSAPLGEDVRLDMTPFDWGLRK